MRQLLPGSKLNEIAGSLLRFPGFQVLIWNPLLTTINEIAAGTINQAPLDITPFVESVQYSENVGFENGDDPSTPTISVTFRRNPSTGRTLRRGLIEDGVIVQVRQGDERVIKNDWLVVFTGTFRGRPGDDPGTPGDQTEGMSANAYGREERFLNVQVTSDQFPVNSDVGDMAVAIAQKHMGLTQNEILFGSQGFESKHLSNQLVEVPALQAIWELLFTVVKKPKFDSLGRLIAVDVNLDKPAARVYSDGNVTVTAARATPNDVEVNNVVVLRGLSSILTKIVSERQLLTTITAVTGFFDSEFEKTVFYSEDHSQRAQETYVVPRKRIRWSDADWTELDEFHGVLEIDTRHLRNVRALIFATFLAVQIVIAIIDLFFHKGGSVSSIINALSGNSIAKIRFGLQLASMAALAGLLWSMNFIGRGEYEIWGRPFEFVYRELVAEHQLVGLEPEEVRRAEYRNDFISDMDTLDDLAAKKLRREILKNQLYEIVVLDDPLLEVDDVIELADGGRYYVVTISKTLQRGVEPLMNLACWKIFDPIPALVSLLTEAA